MSDRDCTSPTRPKRAWWTGAANPKTPAGQRHPNVVPSPAACRPRQPQRLPRLVVQRRAGLRDDRHRRDPASLVEGTHIGSAEQLTEVNTQ